MGETAPVQRSSVLTFFCYAVTFASPVFLYFSGTLGVRQTTIIAFDRFVITAELTLPSSAPELTKNDRSKPS
jgi:hypothetical protein